LGLLKILSRLELDRARCGLGNDADAVRCTIRGRSAWTWRSRSRRAGTATTQITEIR